MPKEKPRRHPELSRWYAVVALGTLVFLAFRLYRALSPRLDVSLDPYTRWSLLSVGLINTLAIASLLFLVARNLAKVWFERRRGILGGRIRSRLVLALLGVGILPSLLLYLIGQDFISKNLDRWFRPETTQVIEDGRRLGESYRQQVMSRLEAPLREDWRTQRLETLRHRHGVDLLVRRTGNNRAPEIALAPGRPLPSLNEGTRLDTPAGQWHLLPGPELPDGSRLTVGILVPHDLALLLTRLENRSRDLIQVQAGRQTFEALPQNTFLLLTLLCIFAAVWTGLTLSRAISEPVQALADAARNVGAGRLDIHLEESGQDELAFLSRTFNRMTRDLKGSREAIEAQAERIEQQRAYLGQLLEALPVGVLSWTPQGALRTLNPAARRWLDLEGWEGQWEDVADQPRFGSLPGLLEGVLRDHTPRLEETRIGSEGEGRPVRAIVVPLATGGVLALLEDLTQLALAEKRAAWQEVARRMAHEVKNPLTPIKLTAQRLLRRSREDRLDAATVRDGVETILNEVNSLQVLVDSFSRFAKLPAPQFRDVDAGDLVRQVAALYIPNHPAHRWTLDLPEGPLPVHWDPEMVKRALINLIDNALGALAHPGHIQIRLLQEAGTWLLSVEDDGPGIPPDMRERLFQPYFSTKKKGTGLGLAIVRRIAQDHGGDARHQALTPGARFTLTLP